MNGNNKPNSADKLISVQQQLIRQLQEQLAANTTRQVVQNESPDSLTIGAPTNGQVKVYGNFRDKKEFAGKIRKAMSVLSSAKREYDKMKNEGK